MTQDPQMVWLFWDGIHRGNGRCNQIGLPTTLPETKTARNMPAIPVWNPSGQPLSLVVDHSVDLDIKGVLPLRGGFAVQIRVRNLDQVKSLLIEISQDREGQGHLIYQETLDRAVLRQLIRVNQTQVVGTHFESEFTCPFGDQCSQPSLLENGEEIAYSKGDLVFRIVLSRESLPLPDQGINHDKKQSVPILSDAEACFRPPDLTYQHWLVAGGDLLRVADALAVAAADSAPFTQAIVRLCRPVHHTKEQSHAANHSDVF